MKLKLRQGRARQTPEFIQQVEESSQVQHKGHELIRAFGCHEEVSANLRDPVKAQTNEAKRLAGLLKQALGRGGQRSVRFSRLCRQGLRICSCSGR